MQRTSIGRMNLQVFATPLARIQGAKGKIVIGMIYGFANSVIARSDARGEMSEGLKGIFIAQDFVASPPKELESILLFVPDEIHTKIASLLREGKKIDPHYGTEFVLKCSAFENKAGGFSWEVAPEIPYGVKHPLSDLMSRATAQPKKK